MENRKDELFQEEMKIIKTRVMLNKLISINLTLFQEIRNYAHTNNIPLRFSPAILRLIDEIEKTDMEAFPPNESLQHRKPNKEFTEP
jgi:hypothetical protein